MRLDRGGGPGHHFGFPPSRSLAGRAAFPNPLDKVTRCTILGSALSGAAQSMGQLVAFRAIQGLGAASAAMLPLFLREQPVRREHRLDLLGTVTLTATITLLLIVLLEGGEAWGWTWWRCRTRRRGAAGSGSGHG